jgi:2,3-bisphosphoglycerate-dependent phosphoglycerate mutase
MTEDKNNYLVLVRHGQSEWNEKNLFTGWKNPPLTKLGRQEARKTGLKIKSLGLSFDLHFTSELVRAQNTGEIIQEEIKQEIETLKNIALNERDYGDLSGLNKDEARKEWGEEQVHIWRRSYDIPPPGGESLKDTLNRVLPYFEKTIKPELDKKKNILVTAHGNSLRALIKKIENISSNDIVKLEIATGEPIIYSFFEERFVRLTI